MGGGTAHFGRRGQKSPKLKKVVKKFSTYGPRGMAHRDLKGRRQRTSRDGAVGPGRGGSVGHPATPFKRTSETFFFAQQSLQFLSWRAHGGRGTSGRDCFFPNWVLRNRVSPCRLKLCKSSVPLSGNLSCPRQLAHTFQRWGCKILSNCLETSPFLASEWRWQWRVLSIKIFPNHHHTHH